MVMGQKIIKTDQANMKMSNIEVGEVKKIF